MRRLLSLALLASLIAPAAAEAANPPVVISEFRFRGPGGGNDEFVELRNAGAAPIAIGGWQLRGCSAAGSSSTRTTVPAGTTLPPGASYLFTNSSSTAFSGAALGDARYGTGIADNGAAQLFSGSGAGAARVDAVGAAGNPCSEGTGLPIPETDGDNSFERIGGTQDTDSNAADFTGPKPSNPQNLSGARVDDVITRIHAIQGPGAGSPMTSRPVTIEGVVTGVDDEVGSNFERTFPADAGIFVQEEAADADGSAATSEGIYVGFVRDRAAYPPGTVVRVTGWVRENFGETRIEENFGQEPVRVGTAAIPEAVTIDAVAATAQAYPSRTYYESLEGMNVRLAAGTATVGATNKFGELFLTPGDNHKQPSDRVFRTENPPELIAADADAGAGDPDNPLIDTDSTTEIRADLFDVVRNVVGPLGFAFTNYRILNQPPPLQQPSVERDAAAPYPLTVERARGGRLRFATYNVENFFPVGGDVDRHIVTEEEYEAKRDDIVEALDERLRRPHVIALQEVVDKQIADDLARQLRGYRAYLEEGNDSRGIDVAFLVRKSIKVVAVRQLGKEATTTRTDCADSPSTGGQPRLFDRPPLAVDMRIARTSVTAISNHFASKSHPDACRAEQATFVRDEVERIEAAGGEAIVAGDLNSFEDEIALTILEGPETSLDNLWDMAPEHERYSFAFQGRLQTLDHVLVTDGLAPFVEDFAYVHLGNDYFDRRRIDGHDASDHDPALVTFDPPSRGDDDSDSDSDSD